MADGLFDNRYRYDYIYPRGRSGETLRAFDTAQSDRPVVIKRPAPNDAPPIRAGQEVSILNERKALTRLSGHPVLTEYLGSGQFFVGGMPHQYIVMERAEGMIVADTVLELARSGERLPQLEMLVIIDRLLDLLQVAHARDIVYNDVDAKHLFWDRDTYRLKVIDWGNAVFLEGDEVTPQGISRQTDIQQVGELVYFILSGGGRADIPRDAGEDFSIDFGQDVGQAGPRLQAIVSKAVHPNTNHRYENIGELRRDLEEYRKPLERERDTIVNRLIERLSHHLSKEELRGLLATLEPALASDPGYPEARRIHQEINDRLRDLDVSADLDAVSIYMESGNWSRAADLLNELRDKAGSGTAGLVELLLDCNLLLLDSELPTVPSAVLDAVALIFEGHIVRAAHTLLTEDHADPEARRIQWLLAERISSRLPDVLLLRPNLYRLELALNGLATNGVNISEARALLAEIQTMLDDLPGEAANNLVALRDGYRAVVDRLTTLNKLLSTVGVQHRLSDRKLPLSSLDRALNATMALADNMHVVGRQAVSSPRDALVALDNSRAIDPTNALWNAISRLLDSLYELLQSYQTYVPAADGSDLAKWLDDAHEDLAPFLERMFDEMLAGMIDGLEIAAEAWSDYAAAAVHGDRVGAVTSLSEAAEAVGTVSPTLAGWLNQLRTVVNGATYVERHAVYGGLGRALADGWEAFDRGRLADAERLGQQAIEISRSEFERDAANRLLRLASTTRDWVERNGVTNAKRTQKALQTVESLYTEEEVTQRDHFATQMPSNDTYLRAVTKGLVEPYNRTSTAAARLFFYEAILLGTLEAHKANLDDAEFWREVAVRALGEYGPRHTATRALDDFVERRRDLNAAADLVNQITGTHALDSLDRIRRKLEENPQARTLAAAIHSLREFQSALRDWSDGEFRPAGLKLENAINAIGEVEQAAGIDLTPYRAWLVELQAAAAELHNLSRQMHQAIERRPAVPVDIIHEAHVRQAEMTTNLLGEAYSAQLRQWRDTYESFLNVYTDTSVRRSVRLNRFNELFRAMFIDRHPAYSLYRHWYDITEGSPEFPAPPTDEPTPRLTEGEPVEATDYLGSRYIDPEEDTPPPPRRGFPVRAVVFGVVGILVVALAFAAINGLQNEGGDGGSVLGIDVTISDTPDASETAAANTMLAAVTEGAGIDLTPEGTSEAESGPLALTTPTLVTRIAAARTTQTDAPSETPLPTDSPTPETPSATPTPTLTRTPTFTPTPTPTPTPTLPPQGLQGWQDLLALLDRMDEYPWQQEQFAPASEGAAWRLGTGEETPGEEIVISLPAETLDQFYGNDASSRVRRADAVLSFSTYDPNVMELGDAYFGIMLQSTEDETIKAGLHIQMVTQNLNAVNLYLRSGDEIITVRQEAVHPVGVSVRLERDPTTGAAIAYFNNFQIGEPIPFVAPEAPVEPALFIKDGGVIVHVNNWRIGLR